MNGRKYTGESDVGTEVRGDVLPGDPVDVQYLQDDPGHCISSLSDRDYHTGAYAGAVIVIILTGLLPVAAASRARR